MFPQKVFDLVSVHGFSTFIIKILVYEKTLRDGFTLKQYSKVGIVISILLLDV